MIRIKSIHNSIDNDILKKDEIAIDIDNDKIKEFSGQIIAKFDTNYIKNFSGQIQYKLDGFLTRKQLMSILALMYAS